MLQYCQNRLARNEAMKDTESDADLEDELEARLAALYGVATATAKRQAREVLLAHFGGDVSLFLTQFLSPAVTLLDQLRHQVCLPADSGVRAASPGETGGEGALSPDGAPTPPAADVTWPLALDDAVLVHLCDAAPAAHLAHEGDFYFCLRSPAAGDLSSSSSSSSSFSAELQSPSLVIRLQQSEEGEVKEFPVPECQFRRVFSGTTTAAAMDWVEKARQAPDHELSYILRQCLIATEYTVRHLQWQEVLERNGLHLGPPSLGQGQGRPGVSDSARTSRRDSSGDELPAGRGAPSNQAGDSSCVSPPSRRDSRASSGGEASAENTSGGSSTGTVVAAPVGRVSRSNSASTSELPSDSERTSSRSCAGSDVESDSRRRSGSGGSGQGSAGGPGSDTGRLRNGSFASVDSDRSSSSRGSPPCPRREQAAPARSSSNSSSSSSSNNSNSTYYTRRHLEAPQAITQLDRQLLHSGIAILPGSSDVSGRRIIFIFTCSVLWHNRQVISAELTRLLMYYYSVPRRELVSPGFTIVVDIRGATSSTVNILLESLYLFKDNIANSVSVIHMLADKPTQSLVLKSPVYDPHSSVGVDLMLSQELLLRSVSLDQLPPALDGTFPYSHEEWVRFRMKVEPFLNNCVAVAQYLVEIMQEISSSDYLPRSTQTTRELIARHEQQVKAAFSDPRLLSIQNDGEAIMSSLRREENVCCHSEDYRHALEKVSSLYRQLQDSMSRLAHLADARLNRLQQCLQLRGFEEECDKVLSWLKEDGQALLERHSLTADNLKAVRSQQKDFEKLYFSAMTHIEKGNDLIEEASMLAQSGAFSESALGYKDGARLLKKQLQLFTAQLEDSRERIEGTARCYTLLDKSYEWALEAMKYVASMKMEHCASASGLDKLLRSLEQYLGEHPPLCEDTFVRMIDTAQRLHNEKLLEQCRVAKARCQETYHLLLLRRNTLQRARDQLMSEHGQNGVGEAQPAARAHSPDTVESVVRTHERTSYAEMGGSSSKSAPHPQTQRDTKCAAVEEEDFPVWEPRNTSTPSREEESWVDTYGLRRPKSSSRGPRSIGGPAVSDLNVSGDSRGLMIPDPVTDKLVSSPASPATFPDRSSSVGDEGHEFKTPLSKGPARLQLARTISTPATPVTTSSPISVSPSSSSSALSSHRHQKKMLKRASTAPVPMLTSPIIYEDQEVVDTHSGQLHDRGGKTLSMMTGSSESLPSMPEEDEEYQENSPDSQASGGGGSTQWTPVSVNSHLHSSRLTPTGPMADLRLSGAEMKSRRTVLLIMSEMVQTERDYARSLQYVIENYIPELQRVDVPQLLRGKRNVIFGNIEKIYQFHSQYFLRELEACQHNPFLVGHYFLRHESQFHLYTLYNKNKPKSDDLMMELGKGFFRHKQLQLGDRMDLASYLLKPVQRMGKYALLLKQILKECPETEPEYADLKAAEEMVRFQLRHGNDLLAMDSLRECDVNLQEQGKLLRQDEFLVFQGRKKMIRRVFLFEDLILFSKTRRGRQGQHDIYVYKHSLKMADIGMTESFGDSGYKFEIWFRRRSLGDNYILQAPNSEVKRAWVKEITRILWHQAIRNRESHINEMASMGIGTKPCMDIKPSRDNIQDRSLNVDLPNRGARTRNSIAVSSFEYLRGGTKRPHSIISVSSNSSSNSSHSSAGLFGSLNLAFDPVDGPRFQRQSLLSNESGIETDHSAGDGDPGGGKPQQRHATPASPDQSYPEALRTRVFNQNVTEPVMTDV